MFWVTSGEGIVTYANPAFEAFVGRVPGTTTGLPLDQVFPSAFVEEYHRANVEVLTSGNSTQLIEQAKRADGSTGYFLVQKFPIKREFVQGSWQGLVAGHALDITESEGARERLDVATKTTGMGIYDVNLRDGSMTWSPAMFQHYGVKAGEFEPTLESIRALIHPEDLRMLNLEGCDYSPENSYFRQEFRIVQPSGNVRHIRAQGRVYFDAQGVMYRSLGTQYDITEEHEFSERFRNLAMIAELAKTAVVICDKERRIDWVNSAFEEMSGFGLEEVKGKRPNSFIFCRGCVSQEWRDMVMALARGKGFQGELLCCRKNGQRFWTELQVQPMRNTAGEITHYVAIGSDITERKIRQEETAHNDRLITIGRLASGVAHEINNPLNILMGAMNLFRDRLPSPEEFSKLRDRVLRSCDRIDSIVKGLRTFSRSDAQALVELDLGSFLGDTVAFFEPLLNKKKAKITLQVGEGPMKILGDSSRLQQVMANLITNALDATAGRAAPELMIRAFQEGQEAVLVVSDNGTGIAKENLSRVFDPFYTSKPAGQGTGLGLSICYGIVHAHSGQISVESEPGEGTSIYVRLPLAGSAEGRPGALSSSSSLSGLESGQQN